MPPILLTLGALAEGVQLIAAIAGSGFQTWSLFKAFLAQNNIAADTAKLDEIILDAEARQRAREAEAQATE